MPLPSRSISGRERGPRGPPLEGDVAVVFVLSADRVHMFEPSTFSPSKAERSTPCREARDELEFVVPIDPVSVRDFANERFATRGLRTAPPDANRIARCASLGLRCSLGTAAGHSPRVFATAARPAAVSRYPERFSSRTFDSPLEMTDSRSDVMMLSGLGLGANVGGRRSM